MKCAEAKINKIEEEKKELKASLDKLSTGGSYEEQDLVKKALASQLNGLRQDKARLENEKDCAVEEKEKFMKEVEKLKQELEAAKRSTTKHYGRINTLFAPLSIEKKVAIVGEQLEGMKRSYIPFSNHGKAESGSKKPKLFGKLQ